MARGQSWLGGRTLWPGDNSDLVDKILDSNFKGCEFKTQT